jgi:Zn finger protein HypA/HybF involved in hydrogenase expression
MEKDEDTVFLCKDCIDNLYDEESRFYCEICGDYYCEACYIDNHRHTDIREV